MPPDAPSRVPVEFIGLARAFRRAVEAEEAMLLNGIAAIWQSDRG